MHERDDGGELIFFVDEVDVGDDFGVAFEVAKGFDRLDDAGALGLINAHFDRDARMVALRRKWLPQFQDALGTKLAVRVMQIDRRLSLAHQIRFAAKLSLHRTVDPRVSGIKDRVADHDQRVGRRSTAGGLAP